MRMKVIGLLVGAAALVLPVAVASGQAAASTPSAPTAASTTTTKTPNCVLTPSPSSFVETGLTGAASSVAYVLTVECKPVYGEQSVQINAEQLNNACHNTLSWYSATAADGTEPLWGSGQTFTVVLDDDGNATAVVWGGPSCAATRDLVTADLLVAPFTTAKTHVTIAADITTPPRLSAHPASEVEDATTSSVAAIFYAEFPSVHAGQTVEFSDAQLAARCSITWVGADEVVLGTGASVTTTLDDNGNAFVVALAGPNCPSGKTLAQVDLVGASYRTLTANFTIESPRPTA